MSRSTGLTRWSQDKINRALSLAEGFDEVVFVQSLDEIDFATNVNWDVTGQWDDTGGNAALVFAAGAIGGTLTQVNADMASAALDSKEYVFTYTVAVTTAPDGDFALVISAGVPESDVTLPYTAGTHSVYFQSAAAASAADFVITASETTATQGSITIDNVSLTRCCDAGSNPDTDEWVLIKPIEGNATVSATSVVGDALSSVTILEQDAIRGRFSRILVTAGNVVAYRL